MVIPSSASLLLIGTCTQVHATTHFRAQGYQLKDTGSIRALKTHFTGKTYAYSGAILTWIVGVEGVHDDHGPKDIFQQMEATNQDTQNAINLTNQVELYSH